jgi:hypothetical protein
MAAKHDLHDEGDSSVALCIHCVFTEFESAELLLWRVVIKVHAAFESASKQLAQHPTTGLFFINVSPLVLHINARHRICNCHTQYRTMSKPPLQGSCRSCTSCNNNNSSARCAALLLMLLLQTCLEVNLIYWVYR